MERSLTLLRVRGIPIGVNWSWLFIAALLAWVLGSALFPATHPGLSGTAYLAMAVAAVVLFFASILLHELAHALVGLREGVKIEGITLWLLGGVARFTGGVPSPRTELRMTIVGPLTSLALAAVFGLLALVIDRADLSPAAGGVVEYLARINLILAAFNLVPAMPLDGGRILRAWLWKRQGSFQAATVSAAKAGRAFGFVLIWVGLLGFLTGAGIGGFWFVILGWFLLQAASAEASSAMLQETFRGKRVRDVMTPDPEGVEAAWSLQRFVEEAGRPSGHSTYPVLDGGRLVGLMSLRQAGNVPPDERSYRRVAEAMMPRSDVPTVRADTPAVDALEVLQGPSGRAMVVEADDRVVGILSSADVARALEIERLRARPAAAPTRRAGLLVWVVVGLIMAAAAGYLYHPPLAVLSPAPAVDVVEDISISGTQLDRVNGRYLMVPVRVSRPNALGALFAAFDPSRDVVPLSEVLPVGSDAERIAREQRALHRESQVLAATAAADVLGLPVALDGSGARVVEVVSGTPAARALQAGDVIVAVDEVPVRLAADLREAIGARPAGTTFTLSIERGDVRRQIQVSSARLEEGRAALGVVVETRGLEVDLPFEIEFRDRPVGGPSAGLAYALAIVDLLDPGDLAAGRTIAASGTVDASGAIGPVAGLAGKATSAREAGATVFLVSTQNVQDVPDEELEVIGSGSLAEALAALRSAA